MSEIGAPDGAPSGTGRSAVSIVIVAYNDAASLDACLRSIKCHEPSVLERGVLVVDNSSHDEVGRMLALKHKDVKCVANPNNGYGAANNRGARLVEADVILFLNPDTELRGPIIQEISSKFDSQPDLGALGVQLMGPDGRMQQSFFWVIPGGILKSLAQHAAFKFGFFSSRSMCTSGAALAVRRNAFIEVGQFDEDYFLYCEEPDLWRRLQASGWRWTFEPRLTVTHIGGTSTPEPCVAARRRLESLEVFCRKHGIDYSGQLEKEIRYMRFVDLIRAAVPPWGRARPGRGMTTAVYREALSAARQQA